MNATRFGTVAYVPSTKSITKDNRNELERQVCDAQSATSDLAEDALKGYLAMAKTVYRFFFK